MQLTTVQLVSAMKMAQTVRPKANCPRSSVGAAIFNIDMEWLGSACNQRMAGPCNCNDGADTNTEGSKTCEAVHAEMAVLAEYSDSFGIPTTATGTERGDRIKVIAVTRPPCQKCAEELLKLPYLEWIITTMEYPDRDKTLEMFREKGYNIANFSNASSWQ